VSAAVGIPRKNIYSQSRQEQRDLELKAQIEAVHLTDPAYGHRRLAWKLGINKKRILRVMRKYGIKPPRRKIKRKYITKSTSNHSYTNLIKELEICRVDQVWTSDLTFIPFNGSFIYLAVVKDSYTRRVLGARISNRHNADLSLATIKLAVANERRAPEIFHSDQGTEFMAEKCTGYLGQLNTRVSVSDKGKPWQNGSQESFFGRFKDDMGDISRFETLGELIEEIYSYVHYYNHYRIHTAIKTTPQKFSESCLPKWGT
jgi:putative transposase